MEFRDRVKQTTATTGTGAYTISALAVPGSTTFAASFSDGATVPYCCASETDYEVGIGTYTAATNSLSRDTILSSSNSGAAVNWGVGPKDIIHTVPGCFLPTYSTSDPTITANPPFVGAKWINTTTGEMFVCRDAAENQNSWVGSLGSYVADTGLLIDYNFISGVSGSTVTDQTGNYNATIQGALASADGLYFDGTNDYLDCGAVAFPTDAFTVMVRGKSDDYNAYRGFFSIDQTNTGIAVGLIFFGVGTPANIVSTGGISVPAPNYNGFPFDYSLVWDGTEMRFYSGGALSAVATGTLNGSGIPAGNLFIGCGLNNRSRTFFFIGSMARFQLYAKALTATEIHSVRRLL